MLLANPPSYMTAAQLKAIASDFDLTTYTDAQLQDMLNRASGYVNSILRRNLLAQERTQRIYGDGTSRFQLDKRPILYIKRMTIIQPGAVGFAIPISQLLIDYDSGEALQYTPMLWLGQGIAALFPNDCPIDVTYAYGYPASPIVKSPAFTTADVPGTGLAPGTYNLAVTARTMWGEAVASVSQVTTSTGNIQVTVTPGLGAYVYRAYISSAANNTTITSTAAVGGTVLPVASAAGFTVGSQWLLDGNEVVTVGAVNGLNVTITSPLVNAHNSGAKIIPVPLSVTEAAITQYGLTPLTLSVNSLTPNLAGMYQDVFPVVDTSLPVIPAAFTEAVRLLTLSMIYEQNNLANRGVSGVVSDGKRVMWRSTQGSSGRGTPEYVDQARELLAPYKFGGIF